MLLQQQCGSCFGVLTPLYYLPNGIVAAFREISGLIVYLTSITFVAFSFSSGVRFGN